MKFFYLLLAFSFSVGRSEASIEVSFESSMRTSRGYDSSFAAKDERWQILKATYDSYRRNFVLSSEYLIPKNIHLIWLGSPLPGPCRRIVESWKRFHPDWHVRVWTDRDIEWFHLQNQEAYDKAKNYGEKSDIFRYEILYRYGGLYADTDLECLKRFDELHRSCEFYTTTTYDKEAILYNFILGARPGHPIVKSCIDHIQVGNGDSDAHRIMSMTGPYYLAEQFFKTVAIEGYKNAVIFPVTFFCPYPNGINGMSEYAIKQIFVKPESMTIHYWWVSWMR